MSSNTIQRLDLATGSIQPWFQFDGARSFVIGFDHAGAPIIKSLATDSLVWLVPAAGQAQVIEVSTETNFLNLVEPVGDKHGIWFDTTAGDVYLFVPGKGTYYMGATPARGQIAGGCD